MVSMVGRDAGEWRFLEEERAMTSVYDFEARQIDGKTVSRILKDILK